MSSALAQREVAPDRAGQGPLSTIITAVRNDAPGLRLTARSILAQQGVAFEWIVVDGASTDGTLRVIEALATRIAHWSSEPDDGVYDAMNRGIGAARGDYVLFMNAGDQFALPTSLATLASAIDVSAPAVVCGGAVFCYPSGVRLCRPARRVEACIRHQAPCSHQAMLTRTQLLRAMPFEARFQVAADYALVCRLFARGEQFAVVDEIIAVTPHGGASMSYRRAWRSLSEKRLIQREILGCKPAPAALSALRRMGVMAVEWLLSQNFRLRRWPAEAGRLPALPSNPRGARA